MSEGEHTASVVKLHVRPLDWSVPGSYRKRKDLFAAVVKLTEAREGKDVASILAAYQRIEDFTVEYLWTEDGTPVEEALENISADQFDALVQALLGEGSNDPVPPESNTSSEEP